MLLRRYRLSRCCRAFAWAGATLLLGAALLGCTMLLQGWQHPELSVNAFIPHTHGVFPLTRRFQGAARPARWLLRSACPEGCHADGCVGDGAGGMRCTRCSSNLLVDKVTGVCVCPAGSFAVGQSCVDCPRGYFCPGGTFSASRLPPKQQCPDLMTTIGLRSTSPNKCVNLPGTYYAVASGQASAVLCPPHQYGPGLRKQRACVDCPLPFTDLRPGKMLPSSCGKPGSGSTNTSETTCPQGQYLVGSGRSATCISCPVGLTTAQAGAQSAKDCAVVEQGYFMSSPGELSPCPFGEYKSSAKAEDACKKCPPGVTTRSRGSTSLSNCTVAQPGYYATVMVGSVITSTRKCPQKYFCPGGIPARAVATNNILEDETIKKCPDGTWTVAPGASASYDCLTPPGHKTSGGSTTQCADGQYRMGWQAPFWSNECEPCGSNISSVPNTDLLVYSIEGDVSVMGVRGDSTACYVTAGQGIYATGSTSTLAQYMAVNCDRNSFGVANTTYGLAIAPCRGCPGGMQAAVDQPLSQEYFANTTGRQGFTSPLACVTLPGWGYNGRDASRCPVGSYNPGGNRDPCTRCPVGMTTLSTAVPWVSEDDCRIAPGHGYHRNHTLPCPIGTYNDEHMARPASGDAPCKPCDQGGFLGASRLTSSEPGAKSIAGCDLCSAGYGANGGGVRACTAECGGAGEHAGFGPEGRPVTSPDCLPCEPVSEAFPFFFNGSNHPFIPNIVARQRAQSPTDCLAEFAQFGDGAWQLGGDAALNATNATTLMACVDDCRNDSSCQYITYDYRTSMCKKKVQSEPPPPIGAVLAFKTVTTGVASAFDRRSRTTGLALPTGFYTFWRDVGDGVGALQVPGPSHSLAACLGACTLDAECAAVAIAGGGLASNAGGGAQEAPLQKCTLIKGDSSPSTSMRSLIKAAVSDNNQWLAVTHDV